MSQLRTRSFIVALALALMPASSLAQKGKAKPPPNQPPTASALNVETAEDRALDGAVSGSDPDGDALTFRVKRKTTRGKLTLNKDGTFRYEPRANFHGTDGFTFEVSDSKKRATAEVKITVTPVNDKPVASGTKLTTAEDRAVKGRVGASDADGDALTYKLSASAKNGAVKLDAKTGAFTYTPRKDTSGDDAFAIQVSDGKASASAPVTVKVTPVNDAPVAQAGAGNGAEDSELSGSISASDVDGDALRYTLGRGARSGTAKVSADGSWTYKPRANFFGKDSFTVKVSDGKASATSEVTLTVTAVNDGPKATGTKITTAEDRPAKGRVGASDVDGDALTYSLAKQAGSGAVKLDAKTGAFTYTPRKDTSGDDAFAVKVSDGKASATAAVTVKVTPGNDAPLAQAGAGNGAEDSELSGSISASDVDGDALKYTLGRGARSGSAKVSADGSWTYKPRANFFGKDSFTAKVSDGKASATSEVTVTVTAVNDGPKATGTKITTAEDRPATGRVAASDVDGDALSYSVVAQPSLGSVKLDAKSGAFTYTPAKDAHGADKLTVKVSDGKASANAEVSLTVQPVNDPPRAQAGTGSGAEDTELSGSISASDPDGDALKYAIARNGGKGVAKVNASGAWTYKPRANVHGKDSFAVTVSDGKASSTAEVKLTITPVNDPPTATGTKVTTAERGGRPRGRVGPRRGQDQLSRGVAAVAGRREARRQDRVLHVHAGQGRARRRQLLGGGL
jgi:VCBS repeat-containing protein